MLSNTAVPKEYSAFRDRVLRGDEPVNEYVSQQMNIIDNMIASPDYYYNDRAIDGFIDFVESEMTTTDGGKVNVLPSFRLWAEDLLSWYYYIEEPVFDHSIQDFVMTRKLRRLRNKQYLIVGRGAAKSMYTAFLQAYFLTVDPRTTHQIVTAPTMKQADETLSPIRTAIQRSRGPLFKYLTAGSVFDRSENRLKLGSTKKGIENFLTNSLIETRPMRVDKLQGLRSKYNTVDEWLSGRVAEDPIEALGQGASKIDDWIIVATSSEGTVRDGVGDSIKMSLKNQLRGVYDDPHTSIWYYKLDDVSEVGDPSMWPKANPSLGMTVSYETYQRDVKTMEDTPTKRNDILAKRFGIPVSGFTYFFTYEETFLHNKQNYSGNEGFLGVDLSQGDDFTAFTMLFPLSGGRFGVKTLSFVSSSKMAKLPPAMKNKYQEFVDEGTLIIHDETVLNMNKVFDELSEWLDNNDYYVMGVGYDPYNSEQFITNWTQRRGGRNLVKVRQGARTESVPLGELKVLSSARELIFDEKLMSFAMGNAIAEEDTNGNMKLSKARSIEKIDNVAALLDAWVVYRQNQDLFD